MQLTGKKRTESKVQAGVYFTVKALNQVQRAKRDMPILEERSKYSRAIQDRAILVDRICASVKRATFPPGPEGEALYEDARDEQFRLASSEDRARADLHQSTYEAIGNAVIMPAIIRAALVQIEGLVVDGTVVLTIDQFLDVAPDDLIDEVLRLCNEASGLTVEQQKN